MNINESGGIEYITNTEFIIVYQINRAEPPQRDLAYSIEARGPRVKEIQRREEETSDLLFITEKELSRVPEWVRIIKEIVERKIKENNNL